MRNGTGGSGLGAWGGGQWLAIGALLILTAPSVKAGGIDMEAAEQEAAQLLSEYIRIDTSNPPGNETAAAHFLAKRFQAEHIEAQVFESQPGRGSVLARLKGSGAARPIILLNHLDVVPATASEWEVPPFAGIVRDGYVYGRGALDCKGIGVAEAMAMFLLHRNGVKLKRDVIFLGTADEETGGKLGAGWMVANHFEELRDAELVLNEGGDIRVEGDGRHVYAVAVSEKTPCWLRLTASGEAGHGSAPPAETSVTRLLRGLERLRVSEQPLRVTPEVQAYFAAIAVLHADAQRQQFNDLRRALADADFRNDFLGNRRQAALVRNTITPTVLHASAKTNVIPQTASAELDCRLLPDQDPQQFIDGVRRSLDDASIQIEVLLNFPPSSSPTATKLYRVLERMAAAEKAVIAPTVLTGFTDSHYFREKGIASYGFTPFALDEEESKREHGINERLSVRNLREGIEKLFLMLSALDDDGES